MNEHSTIKCLNEIRDMLTEARRYVCNGPQEADELIENARVGLHDACLINVSRIAENLRVARKMVRACPEGTIGYINGALAELAWKIGDLEKMQGDIKE